MSLRVAVSGLMIVTALALGIIAFRLVSPEPVHASPEIAGAPVTPVAPTYLIAAHPLQPGTFLRDEDLSAATASAGHLPDQAITDRPENRASLRGALVQHFIDGGAAVTRADLLRPGDHGFLAAVLQPGLRAVSVAVDAVTGVSGLIWPGDTVDVILTQQLDDKLAPPRQRVLSELVLSCVRVIAVDQDIVREAPAPSGSSSGRLARTVTLQVTTEQTQRVTIAEQLGKLSLAIRSASPASHPALEARTLFSGDVSPALSHSGRVGTKVAVIAGGKTTEFTFQRSHRGGVLPAATARTSPRRHSMPGPALATVKMLPAPAKSADQIIAFVTDELSGAALRAGLGDIVGELVVRRGNIVPATRFLERNPAPRAIIVDITGVEDPTGALEDLARVCPPDVTVAVVGEHTSIDFYRHLVSEVGVSEYLPKPLTRDSVQRCLASHLAPDRAAPSPRGGHLVAVCGAAGGAGATTIAVSIAMQLANLTRSNAALVDLNLQHGAAALMLGVRPGPGLRIALENPERADTLLMERTAIPVGERLRLFGADERLDSSIAISETGVLQVLNLVRQKFNFIVTDLPAPLGPEMQQVLAISRHVVIAMRPDVVSVRNAREIRQLALKVAGADRVVMVLNRSGEPGALPRAMVEKALETPLHCELPDFGKPMLEALNTGVPAIERVPEFRRRIAPLIREIAAMETSAPGTSWLRGLFRR